MIFVKIIGGGIGKFIDHILPPPHYTNVHLAEMVNRKSLTVDRIIRGAASEKMIDPPWSRQI